ncbi:MAG: Holliday junction resolvase RuvX [Granulosicoccaceae bacterium]|jgi:putative Holliday junction resolvase
MTTPQILLGFDFGERRTGVAIGQTLAGTARPLTTLATRDGAQDFVAIGKLIKEWQAGALVVGLPLHMDGSEQPLTDRVRRFARQLEGRFHLPVYLVDERLSSDEASRRTGKKTGIDADAACIILQDWMQQQGFSQ